jgi:hypothetical protein
MNLQQSTAQVRPFDLGAANTGLTLTLSLSKNGAAFAPPTTPALVEIGASGVYSWSASVADTNTVGALKYRISGAGLPTILGYPDDQVEAPASVSGVVVS